MKKETRKKLRLSTETLADLDLRRATGGEEEPRGLARFHRRPGALGAVLKGTPLPASIDTCNC